jgi:hypothetical protein
MWVMMRVLMWMRMRMSMSMMLVAMLMLVWMQKVPMLFRRGMWSRRRQGGTIVSRRAHTAGKRWGRRK